MGLSMDASYFRHPHPHPPLVRIQAASSRALRFMNVRLIARGWGSISPHVTILHAVDGDHDEYFQHIRT
jgi:hypothetical protein